MTLINISLVLANQMQFPILYKISLYVINNINNILKCNKEEMFFFIIEYDPLHVCLEYLDKEISISFPYIITFFVRVSSD